MIAMIAIGLAATLICLGLQALASVLGVQYFAQASQRPLGRRPGLSIFGRFATLMLLLMAGNIVQIAIWALVYRALGAFPDFETAVYFSGVTFTSLGYGDELLTGRVRLLGPLQAASGLMMFGITTAAFISAVQHAVAKRSPTS